MKKREMARTIQRIADDPALSDVQKLSAAFDEATRLFVSASEQSVALARAMGDEETAVKELIKGNVMVSARQIFADCHARVTGERSEVWGE
jgi:hypothetical protein